MILLQHPNQVGTENGVGLWHKDGNAGNSWQNWSVDIGKVDYPFVVSTWIF